MSATTPSTPSPSRRALLIGALGGIGAWAASAAGRAAPVRAAGDDGSNVVIGSAYNDVQSTTILNNVATDNNVLSVKSEPTGGFGGGIAIMGESGSGVGVKGVSDDSNGVRGESLNSIGVVGVSTYLAGVRGHSVLDIGVYAYSAATDQPACLAHSNGNSTGVFGYSGDGVMPAAKPKTGVYGYADQGSDSRGLWGESPAGRAVQGTSSSGFAGYFAGKVYTSKFVEMAEVTAPAAPGPNKSRLFTRDNGSGKTQLCVRFNTGAIQVIATQP